MLVPGFGNNAMHTTSDVRVRWKLKFHDAIMLECPPF